jgi:hypothetical protein
MDDGKPPWSTNVLFENVRETVSWKLTGRKTRDGKGQLGPAASAASMSIAASAFLGPA